MKKEYLKEKIILEEPEEEVLPAVELEDPIEVPQEEPSAEVVTDTELAKTATDTVLNNTIAEEWASIDNLKSVIATLSLEETVEGSEDVLAVLNSVVDEKTIIVGMLQKALDLIGANNTELISQGITKAEEVVGDEVKKDKE